MEIEYFVGNRGEIAKLLGLSLDEVNWPNIDSNLVPKNLIELVPFAEYFGVSDDIVRNMICENTPPMRLKELLELVEKYDDELDEWLAGPESYLDIPSEEYVAFSAMRMAADVIRMS